MDNEKIVPQNNYYGDIIEGPGDQQIAVHVQIEGEFPFVTQALARAYLNEDDEGTEGNDGLSVSISRDGLLVGPGEDEDEDEEGHHHFKLGISMVVAEHICMQIQSWHEFTGVWLAIGDDVEHLDENSDLFRITARTFGINPWRISYTVKYQLIEGTISIN